MRNYPGAAMKEEEFQAKLAELMGEISTLPPAEREKLEQLASETQKRHERLKATVSGLQESLDYLRLSIKYLVFDLEATRRENGYLRKCLVPSSRIWRSVLFSRLVSSSSDSKSFIHSPQPSRLASHPPNIH